MKQLFVLIQIYQLNPYLDAIELFLQRGYILKVLGDYYMKEAEKAEANLRSSFLNQQNLQLSYIDSPPQHSQLLRKKAEQYLQEAKICNEYTCCTSEYKR
jgi:hypothetical protein